MGFYFSQAYFPLPALLSGFQNYEQHFKKLKTKKMIKTLFQRVKTLKSGSGKWEMESLVARTDPALPALPTHPHRGGVQEGTRPIRLRGSSQNPVLVSKLLHLPAGPACGRLLFPWTKRREARLCS